MFLSKSEIERNLCRLTENASPPVKYLTNRYLLNKNPDSVDMAELWENVKTDPGIKFIFSLQNSDGSWFSGGPWGPRGYRRETGTGYTATRPKFVTTAWILPFLGEVGFTAADERIRKGAEFILSGFTDYVSPDSGLPSNCCGLSAVSLWGLSSVGLADDARLDGEWRKITNCQRADGGWLNPNHLADSPTPLKTKGRWPWDRSCVWGTYYAARALYDSRMDKYAEPLRKVLEFLVSHLAAHENRLQTWVFHGHNLVRELEMFCDSGIDMNLPAIQTVLQWLKIYYRSEEGVFRTQDKIIPDFVKHVSSAYKSYEAKMGANYWSDEAKVGASVLRYNLYHLIEDDWFTYRMTRLAIKMAE